MAQLNSPGVAVTVVDESFYTPAAPSTVPLIIVATQENKPNGANTGIAPGTLKANAGLAYLITSQRDLAETFGIPVFKTDANNNPIHAGEQNEYGLQAAYSYLGVSNRAYVVRADIDLGALNPQADAPKADPENGTHWFDVSKSDWGIFEWNGDPKGTGKGQTWTKKVPIIITDPNKVVNHPSNNTPKGSVGAVGDYAIVSLMNLDTNYSGSDQLWFKSKGAPGSNLPSGTWVKVGSQEWANSWPVLVSPNVNISAAAGKTFVINGNSLTFSPSNVDASDFASEINSDPSIGTDVTASVQNNRLVIYANSDDFTISGTSLGDIGYTSGDYYRPALATQPHTSVPLFKVSDSEPRPTGSVWIKTTTPNGGAVFNLKRYDSDSQSFVLLNTQLFENHTKAIATLDRSGGINIPIGTVYVKTNKEEGYNSLSFSSPYSADFTFYRKRASGPTTITSKIISSGTMSTGSQGFFVSESLANSSTMTSNISVSFTLLGNADDAEKIANAINSKNLVNVVASVDSKNRVVISHKLGGEIRLQDFPGANPLVDLFNGTTNASLFTAPSYSGYDWEVSHWEPLRFTSSSLAPTSLTKDGSLWYSSVVDEVDIMIHNGDTWVGYSSSNSPISGTDPLGPLVGATRPVLQSDGTPLVSGDLWIDTSDLENYPRVYKFDNSKTTPIATRWVLVDSTDQSSEDGILFADARWNTTGGDEDATIVQLLDNDHLDPDAPDPALYPRGMLLWNMRRSGFNVKQFKQNYINLDSENPRITLFDSNGDPYNPLMDDYYPHRWVTVSGRQENGAGNFGRMAQRRVVVQSLQAVTNSSRDIREEARVFNLLACPGYPELIGEMISLNFDRALTAFIVGDTPSRLTPDSTSLKAWGDNLRLAVEDNDFGGASYDEYLGMFYPWGFTSDNFGNNVVVPPSHMMLRTIALSDSVSYPWFAPAGTRRGGITNATNVGYIDKEGEFVVVALSNAARDTLYEVKINPITFFTGVGLVNYGQKTRAKAVSALDRINVARLVIYLRRQLDILAKPYIFEPNDKITRDQIRSACESLMLELVGQRALYDYIVVCDESNNTPARIDKNELYVDIAIEPVKAVEFIYIPLRLKNTGEIAGL